MKTKKQIAPKDKRVTVFLRNVSVTAKKKFNAKAKSLGYLPRELFEILVKDL